MKPRSLHVWLAFAPLLGALELSAQPPASGPMLSYAAATANVSGADDAIRIDLFRWSTEAERSQIAAAWENKGTPRPASPGRARAAAAAGAAPPSLPSMTPEESLGAALQRTATVGYLWSSETAGYALRYAGKLKAPDGTERVILITDRRLGKRSGQWTPLSGTPSAGDFSVIELRMNAKGEGEGRVSLVGKLAAESAMKIPVPESYDALPVVLKNLKLRAGASK